MQNIGLTLQYCQQHKGFMRDAGVLSMILLHSATRKMTTPSLSPQAGS